MESRRTLLLATIVGCIYFVMATADAPKNDFLQFYLAAKSTPFSYQSITAQANALAAAEQQHPMPFVRLPFYALLVRPLAALSYRRAYIVWQLLAVVAFVLAMLVARKRYPKVPLAFLWSVPVALAFLRGQDVMLVLLLLLTAVYLLDAGAPFCSGLVVSMCLLKWSLFLPLPVVLVYHFPKRAWLGTAVGSLAVLGSSFLIAGPRWPIDYIAVLRTPAFTPSHGWTMPNLYSLLSTFGRPADITLLVAASIMMIGMAWLVIRRTTSLYYAIAAACIAGIAVTPHSYVYDCLILTPFMLAVVQEGMSWVTRWLAVFVLSPCFVWVLLSPLHVIAQIAMVAVLVSMAIDVLGDKVQKPPLLRSALLAP